MSDVGVLYSFRVTAENDGAAEADLRILFGIMAEDEYPTGEVKTYSVYRRRGTLGHFYLFEHFTAKGAAEHSGPRLRAAGRVHMQLMTEPFQRLILEPAYFEGCGAPIASVAPDAGNGAALFIRYFDRSVDPQNVQQLADTLARDVASSGRAKTVGLYKDKGIVGHYCAFIQFTAEGGDIYGAADGRLTTAWPPALSENLYEEIWLDPVIVDGCGEPVPGAPSPNGG